MNFLSPLFLYGLLLTAVPVIIHLFNLQRPKTVLFTNIEFLREVKSVSRARNKIRNLLVLLCRILFIIFLVLAFAQPFIKDKNQATSNAVNRVSVYFDNSMSLQAEKGNTRLFDEGLNFLDQIRKIYPKNTLYQLHTNSAEGSASYYIDAQKFSEKVTTLDFNNASRTMESVHRRQQESFEAGGHHVFWVSDFQKSTVGNLAEIQFDSSAKFTMIPLVAPETPNLYFDSVWLENPFINLLENNLLKVKIVNGGNSAAEGKLVKLFIDGKQVSSSKISVEAGSSATLSMNFALSEAGDKSCYIEVDDSPVAFDNKYYFVLKAAPKIKIISINATNTDYIKNVYSNEPYFDLTEYSVGSVDYNALKTADLIVLQGISNVDNSLQSALLKAIEKQVSIAIFPAEETNGVSYSFTGFNVEKISYNASAMSAMLADIAVPEKENPFFNGVFEKINANMSMPKALPAVTLKSMGASNLLKFKDNQPFLSRLENQGQKVFFFSTPLDSRFGDFAKHALFVPVMYKIAITSKTKSEKLAYTFADNTAILSADSVSKNSIFKLVLISQESDKPIEWIPGQRVSDGKLTLAIPKNNLPAGIYKVILNNEPNRNFGLVALNYTPQESELAAFSPDDLRKTFASQKNVTVLDEIESDKFARDFKNQHISTPLWRYCIVLALLCLFAEILLLRFWKKGA